MQSAWSQAMTLRKELKKLQEMAKDGKCLRTHANIRLYYPMHLGWDNGMTVH